jgi:hypothetical protein
VAKVGTSKAGGTISQQAAVHPWIAADAHGHKQTNNPLHMRALWNLVVVNYRYASLNNGDTF